MSTKEIVFVSNFFGNGGAARVLSVLAKGFLSQGYQVSLCSYAHDYLDEYELAEGVNHVKFYLKRKKGLRRKLERIFVLRKELKKHPNAKIVSFEYFVNMQTIVACFGLKNKLIVSERNDPAKMGGKFPTSILRNFLYSFCDVLVCQTPDAKAYFPKRIQKKTVVIANPVKQDLPSPFEGVRDKRIVNFCRLEKQKNLKLLIDAFDLFQRKHEGYTLHIYGDGKEKTSLEHYITEKNLFDVVSLHKATFDVHQKVLGAAMFVSSSDYEGLSNSMIEAMAIGLPTVCTDCPCGGAKMIIEHRQNGLLVPVGDVDSLCEAMCEIVEDDSLSMTLSANAEKVKETLSVEKIQGYWTDILEKTKVLKSMG